VAFVIDPADQGETNLTNLTTENPAIVASACSEGAANHGWSSVTRSPYTHW